MVLQRVLIFSGGLAGAAGVGLSAAAAHAGGANTGTAASFLLAHAPLLVAVGLLPWNAVLRIGALIVLAGLVFFAGDLLMRDFAGTRLFPMAAPSGGMLMIAGWLVVGVGGLMATRAERNLP